MRQPRFRVCHCSSEEDSGPGTELEVHNHQTVGWESGRFPRFPVEVGLQFEGLVNIESMHILSHEFKIATRVDLFLCDATEKELAAGVFPQYHNARWRRLGHFLLTSNEQTAFKARELKTVHINSSTVYLRLVLSKCHLNPYNFFNQVGIVALDITGTLTKPLRLTTPLRTFPGPEIGLRDLKPPAALPGEKAANSCLAYDPVTAQQIKDLELQKATAVRAEDYDAAKGVKAKLQALLAVASRLHQLESDKKQAIATEDYDQAKAYKGEIERLRRQATGIAGPGASRHSPSPFAPPTHFAAPPEPAYQPAPYSDAPSGVSSPAPAFVDPPAGPSPVPGNIPFDDLPVGKSTGPGNVPFDEQPVGKSTGAVESYDDIPVQVSRKAGGKDLDSIMNATDPFGLKRRPSMIVRDSQAGPLASSPGADLGSPAHPPHAASTTGPPEYPPEVGPRGEPAEPWFDPTGKNQWELDLLSGLDDLNADAQYPIDPLADALQSEARRYESILGGSLPTCLLSKCWQLRELALKAIALHIVDQRPFGASDQAVYEMCCGFLSKKGYGLRDAVSGVFFGACDLFEALTHMASNLETPSGQLTNTISPCLHELVYKSADTNPRVKDIASEQLRLIAGNPVYGASAVYAAVLHADEGAGAKKNAWRILLAKLRALESLVEVYGLQSPDNPEGLDLDGLMQRQVLPGLENPNAEVRGGAIDIVALCSFLVVDRNELDQHLAGLKPALVTAIEQAIDFKGNEAPPARQRQDAAQPKKPRQPEKEKEISLQRERSPDLMRKRSQALDEIEKQIEEMNRSKPDDDEGGGDRTYSEDFDGTAAHDDFTSCQFCGTHDPTWAEDGLDNHYEERCPWLTCCDKCDQVVEIPLLREHASTDCESRDPSDGAPVGSNSSCPLCGETIEPTEGGWARHLLEPPGCPNNTRPLPA